MAESWPRDEAKKKVEASLRERDVARRRHIIGGGSAPSPKPPEEPGWGPYPLGVPPEGIGE